ncbi:MAG: Tol biopolymer transport system, TolR protein, partial [uncultured Craurococcus sp.]
GRFLERRPWQGPRPLPPHGRDQRHAAGRRHAGAAHHLHGGGAADDGRRARRPAEDPGQRTEPGQRADHHHGESRGQNLPAGDRGAAGGACRPAPGHRRGQCPGAERAGAPHLRPRRQGDQLWPRHGGDGRHQRRRLQQGRAPRRAAGGPPRGRSPGRPSHDASGPL